MTTIEIAYQNGNGSRFEVDMTPEQARAITAAMMQGRDTALIYDTTVGTTIYVPKAFVALVVVNAQRTV